MKKWTFIFFIMVGASPEVALAQDLICSNPGNVVFNPAPKFKSPDETRGDSIRINRNGALTDLPDKAAECLPLSLRYNNPGALQTRQSGPWPGQFDKDSKGHAVFQNLEDGIAAWALWTQTSLKKNPKISAFEMMSRYAPPTDCVGTVKKLPNGECPPGFPLNPTRLYAARVAQAIGKTANDPLELQWNDCLEQRAGLFALFREIMTFEAGYGFCGKGLCSVDRAVFNKAIDRVAGPIDWAQCGPEAYERYTEDW